MRKLRLVQIQTTSVCNARCVFCPYKDSWFVSNPGYMTDAVYTKILNAIKDYNPKFSGKFCPYLMNEPFTDKQLINRVKEAIKVLPNMYLEISSNFVLPSKTTIDKLVDLYSSINYNGRIMISHHGITSDEYTQTMKLEYGKAIDNIKYLVESTDKKLNIYIHGAVQTRDNKLKFSTAAEQTKFWQKTLGTSTGYTYYPLRIHTRAGNVKHADWQYNRIVRQIDETHPFDCPRLYHNLHVIYTGEVVLCCCDYNREVVVGDLTKININELYDSKLWIKTKNMVRGYEESPADFLCKRCSWPGG